MRVSSPDISNPITSLLTQNTGKEGVTLKRLAEYGRSGVETGVNYGSSIGLTFVGFLSLLAGAIGKTLAPDKSSFDLLSLFGIIAGGIMSAFGLYKVATVGSKAMPKNIGSGYFVKGAEGAVSRIKTFDENIQQPYDRNKRSKTFMNDFQGISQTDKDNLRANILEYYTICLNELYARYSNMQKDKVPPVVKIGDREFNIESLGDEVINLLGNLIYLRNETGLDADKIGTEDLSDIVDEVLTSSTVTDRYTQLLPHNFNVVFTAARHYVGDHSGADSIKKVTEGRLNDLLGSEGCTVSNLGKLTELLSKGTNPQRKKAWQYLNEIEQMHNTLTILDRAIQYVIQNSESEDKNKAQKACRLRQALICGFALQGQSIKQIYDLLGDIQNGTDGVEALSKKLSDLKEFRDKLRKEVLKPEVKLREQPREIDDVFPQRLGLFEFVELQTV